MPLAARKTTPFKRSSKTPTPPSVPSKPKHRRSIILDDDEDTENENWVEDLREYLKNHLQRYIDGAHLSEQNQDILKRVVHTYRKRLAQNKFDQHTRGEAWDEVLDLFNRELSGERTNFDPDSDIEESPKLKKKVTKRKRRVKRAGSARVSKFLGVPIPKSPQRTRVINLVSKWVNGYGIKPKSKYILKMDIILGDALRPDDWNKDGLRTKDIANNIIQEFQDRYPDYMRVLKKRNKEPVERRKPVWSEATLAKREPNRAKREQRAQRKALYEQYKLLPKGRMKKDFNIQHGRYKSGMRRKKARYTKEEIDGWGDATKKALYLAGRAERQDLKGLTRQGRLAYYRQLRSTWTPEQLEAWRASWKAKSAPWKRKRGVEDPPKRKKLIARKSQGLPLDDIPVAKRTRSRKGAGVPAEVEDGIQLRHV